MRNRTKKREDERRAAASQKVLFSLSKSDNLWNEPKKGRRNWKKGRKKLEESKERIELDWDLREHKSSLKWVSKRRKEEGIKDEGMIWRKEEIICSISSTWRLTCVRRLCRERERERETTSPDLTKHASLYRIASLSILLERLSFFLPVSLSIFLISVRLYHLDHLLTSS